MLNDFNGLSNPIEDVRLGSLDISIVQLKSMQLFVKRDKSVHYRISKHQVSRIETLDETEIESNSIDRFN